MTPQELLHHAPQDNEDDSQLSHRSLQSSELHIRKADTRCYVLDYFSLCKRFWLLFSFFFSYTLRISVVCGTRQDNVGGIAHLLPSHPVTSFNLKSRLIPRGLLQCRTDTHHFLTQTFGLQTKSEYEWWLMFSVFLLPLKSLGAQCLL